MKEPKSLVPVAYLVAYLLLQYKGSILLVRPLGRPEDEWGLPHIELAVGMLPQKALLKMAQEEFGITMAPQHLTCVHTHCFVEQGSGASTLTLFFAARFWEGYPIVPKMGLREALWRRPDELPEDFYPELRLPLHELDNAAPYSEVATQPVKEPHLRLVSSS